MTSSKVPGASYYDISWVSPVAAPGFWGVKNPVARLWRRASQAILAATMQSPDHCLPLFNRIGGRTGLRALLRQFYADVRQHREIGPIFNAQIRNWSEHLEKIGDFWTTATGGPTRYAGPMPQRHFPLGLNEQHFEAWLNLWARNCRIHLTPSAADEMIALATSIGERLRALIALDRARSAAGGELPARPGTAPHG